MLQARRRGLREEGIRNAFMATRISADAKRKDRISLNDYLDELLTPAERAARSAANLTFFFDRLQRQDR